jgi:hypothetical protein
MKQQPDKLFREKLESYSQPAPSSAWDRIETALEEKKPFPWFKIAASIMVLAVALIFAISQRKETNTTAEQKVVQPHAPVEEVQKEKAAPRQLAEVDKPTTDTKRETVIPIERQSNKSIEVERRSNKSIEVQQEAQATLTEQKLLEQPVVASTILPDSALTAPVEDSMPNHLAYRAPEKEIKEQKKITIVLSAEQTKEYLTKKETTEATSKEKKASTLKKLLKKASDLTTDQDPFGDLRQKKNEILALNFKSEKQRGQKK